MRSRDIYLQKITDLKYFLSIFQGNIFYICIFCEYTINKNKLLEYVAISIKKNQHSILFLIIYSVSVFEFSFENLNGLAK